MKSHTFVCNILVFLFLTSLLDQAFCALSADEIEDKLMSSNRTNDLIMIEKLQSANGLGGRMLGRPRLPAPDVFSKGRASATALPCGSTHDISTSGYKFFKMNSKTKNCYHAFLGSRSDPCTVGVVCDGRVTLAPPSSATSGCDIEYLKLSDGTIGLMVGCGSFSFNKKPRIARNNGTDMYIHYKGASTTACVAFCIEDMDDAQDLKDPKAITSNKAFMGFQLEESCTCGKRRDYGRVVGGESANKFEFPWIGAIVYKNYASYKRIPFCGGTLINDRYFISAAHCFPPDETDARDLQVLLHAHVMDRRLPRGFSADGAEFQSIPGWNLPSETDESESSIRVDVEEIINHPLFTPTFDWDVSILRLKHRVNLAGGKVTPACLPRISEMIDYKPGDMHVVAGWGRPHEDSRAGSRVLQKLDVPFVNHDECARRTLPTMRHLCAGFMQGEKDACTGDSGGPLIHKLTGNQYYLSGVVSAGEGCARRGKYGLYTNIYDVVQWIYHHTSDGVWCKR